MYPGIHNYSEIGKLNKVLLHRPGRELEKLTPNNFERLLFDDIPYLKVAQEEHDNFARILQENGVEVCYYEKETDLGFMRNSCVDYDIELHLDCICG